MKPEEIERKACESSNVKTYGYDETSRTLVVEFKSGSIYAYEDVPPLTFSDLQKAPSVGSFIAQRIRGQFTNTQL